MKILGLSTGHDSGASLVVNRCLVAAINEERLSRQKLHIGFPAESIEKVLEISKLKVSEIDYTAIEDKKIDPQNFGEEFLFKNTNKKILVEFKKVSGVGMLVNTSFNIHEEPIVETYHDAIKSFEMSNLDFLVIDKKIIELNE